MILDVENMYEPKRESMEIDDDGVPAYTLTHTQRERESEANTFTLKTNIKNQPTSQFTHTHIHKTFSLKDK